MMDSYTFDSFERLEQNILFKTNHRWNLTFQLLAEFRTSSMFVDVNWLKPMKNCQFDGSLEATMLELVSNRIRMKFRLRLHFLNLKPYPDDE